MRLLNGNFARVDLREIDISITLTDPGGAVIDPPWTIQTTIRRGAFAEFTLEIPASIFTTEGDWLVRAETPDCVITGDPGAD